jgi:hypothetical protein
MKPFILITFLITAGITGSAQKSNTTLLPPVKLVLEISNPQPRIGDRFELSIIMKDLGRQIFSPAQGGFETENYGDKDKITIRKQAQMQGKQQAGPFSFTLNGQEYTTNKVEYEVIPSLPDTASGLWIRTVMTGEKECCIFIEQRIRLNDYTDDEKIRHVELKEKRGEKIDVYGTHTITRTDYTKSTNAATEKYKNVYIIYHCRVDKTDIPITLTKEDFKNVPADAVFKDIVLK